MRFLKSHSPVMRFLRQVFLLFLAFLTILIINCLFLVGAARLRTGNSTNSLSVENVSDALSTNPSGSFSLTSDVKKELKASHSWVMLIDQNGKVVWDYRKPAEIPTSYSRTDIASFTRWYLKDYPVDVWKGHGGLLVMGYPKNSIWKFLFIQDINDLWLLPTELVMNIAMLLIVTYMFVRFNAHERDRARTEWIATVSHDVRTPLQLVLAHSDEITRSDSNDLHARQLAQQIVANTTHVAQLISDLNMANRLEYASQPLNAQKTRIAPLIRSTAAQIINEGLEEKYEINVEIDDAAQTAEAKVDRMLFSRMLTNLLRNSIKHNSDGCTIKIQATIVKTGILWHRNSLKLTVSDTGSGYPEEVLNGLQNLASQYSQSALKTLPEHGLGLLIVTRVAQAHGGTVNFENTPTGSGKATIKIPCCS